MQPFIRWVLGCPKYRGWLRSPRALLANAAQKIEDIRTHEYERTCTYTHAYVHKVHNGTCVIRYECSVLVGSWRIMAACATPQFLLYRAVKQKIEEEKNTPWLDSLTDSRVGGLKVREQGVLL